VTSWSQSPTRPVKSPPSTLRFRSKSRPAPAPPAETARPAPCRPPARPPDPVLSTADRHRQGGSPRPRAVRNPRPWPSGRRTARPGATNPYKSHRRIEPQEEVTLVPKSRSKKGPRRSNTPRPTSCSSKGQGYPASWLAPPTISGLPLSSFGLGPGIVGQSFLHQPNNQISPNGPARISLRASAT